MGLFVAQPAVAAISMLETAEAVAIGTGSISIDDAEPVLRAAGATDDEILRAKVRAWHEKHKGSH